MATEISLSQGQVAIVDDCDADLAESKWHTIKTTNNNIFYAARNARTSSTKSGYVVEYMHRVILARKLGRDLRPGEIVDHMDNDGLCNTRSNLRLATHAQNMRNSRRRKNNSTGYKGVAIIKRTGKYKASITLNGKTKNLGIFDDPEAAYEAYCKAAASPEYHGEFANFGTAQS